MGFKQKLILLSVLSAAALWGCAQNSENHAPICPYGQVLAYDVTGYNCHYESLVPAGYNTLQATQQTGTANAVLTPPVQSCPSGQTLIYWSSTAGCAGVWLCYFSQEIYPPGGSSPQAAVPPAGLGGEYCTGGTTGAYAYGYANTCNNVQSNLTVSCTPGFQCQAGGAAQSNGSTLGLGTGYGQAGTCVYTGYHGY
jgi:hypothetical protein